MTSNRLGRRRILSKHQIPHKRTHGNRQHHESIICHEKQPMRISTCTQTPTQTGTNSHDEEAIKHLHGVQRSHNDLALSLDNPSLVSACYKQW